MEELLKVYGRYGICHYAVQNNLLDVLQWALTHDCPWEFYLCNKAAFYGYLNILKWLHTRYSNNLRNLDICRDASWSRQWHVVRWAIVNKVSTPEYILFEKTEQFLYHMNDMEWLYDHYGVFKDTKLKEFIAAINLLLLHIVEIPDLVKLIKSYV